MLMTLSFTQFTAAAGLSFDASGLLGNSRSQRYVAVIEVSRGKRSLSKEIYCYIMLTFFVLERYR